MATLLLTALRAWEVLPSVMWLPPNTAPSSWVTGTQPPLGEAGAKVSIPERWQ
jgi:hypothetical protein